MKSRITKAPLQHVRPKREGMDAKHLVNVRGCPCAACGTGSTALERIQAGIQAHHLLRTDERGLSRKSSDRWAIPLCFLHHNELHAAGDEEAYLASKGIDGRAVASALWAVRGDLAAMRRVIFRARQSAALTVRTNA